MSTNITSEELLEYLGPNTTVNIIARHRKLAFVPPVVLERLANEALSENWAIGNHALEKYLAVNVAWSIEQGQFVASGEQFCVTAGHLRTRYGSPIYLIYERNRNPGRQPFALKLASSDVRSPAFPAAPQIPAPAMLPAGAEIEMRHDHMLVDHRERLSFLEETPPVAQVCAISGAIQWSLCRGLQWRYWYYGRMDHIVPVYLQSRENITETPDLVAPIQVRGSRLLVRTLLLPHYPFPNARVAVERHDQLPHWLVSAWKDHARGMSEAAIDDPEGEAS